MLSGNLDHTRDDDPPARKRLPGIWNWLGPGKSPGSGQQSQFPVGAFTSKSLSQFNLLPGASSKGEVAQSLGGGEIGGSSQLFRGVAQKSSLQSWSKFREAVDVEGKATRGGTTPTSDRPPGQQQLRRDAVQFLSPPPLLIPSQFRQMREVFAQTRIPGFELWQELMTDPVSGEGEMQVGGVFAPCLAQPAEIGLYVGPARGQQGPHNPPLGVSHNRVDTGQALRPCASQQFRQNSLCLVVPVVRSGHRFDCPRSHQFTEPAIAETPRSLLDGFDWFAGLEVLQRSTRSVDSGFVKAQIKASGQVTAKIEVGVGFCSTQPVVEMGHVEHQSQLGVPLGQYPQQSHRIHAAGEPNRNPRSRLELGCVDRQ